MKKSHLRSIMAGATVIALPIGTVLTGGPAIAEPQVSAAAEASMRAVWTAYDIPNTTQDSLLSELEQGHMWDSLSGDNPSSREVRYVPGGEETIDRYADGSIRVTTVTADSPTTANFRALGGITPQASIDSCTTLASTSYDLTRRCNVSTNVVVANAAFTVTFHAVTGSNTEITDYSSLLTSCIVGTCTNKYMVLDRRFQSGTTPASVSGWWTWISIGATSSKDFWLNFSVKGTTVSASNN